MNTTETYMEAGLDEHVLEVLAAAGYSTARFMLLSMVETVGEELAGDAIPTWEELSPEGKETAKERVIMIVNGDALPNGVCFGFKGTVTTLCGIMGITVNFN